MPLKEPMPTVSCFVKNPCLLAVASLISLPVVCLGQNATQTIPSIPLYTFQQSMGVNLHIEYTDGKYADATAVLNDLRYLGITNVRDAVPQPANWLPVGQGLAAMQMLASNGIRFNLLAAPNQALATSMQQLDNLVQANPGMVLSVEGPNEINNQPVSGPGSNEQNAEAYQRSLYSAVHSDSNLQGVPVYYFTGGAPIDLTNAGLADYANTHPYAKQGVQPYTLLPVDFASYFTMSGTYNKAITETGYSTLPYQTDPDGVDEPSQAEMILNSYFDAALQGVSHTYVYQLLDPYTDSQNNNSDDHFGFFHLDNSPKIVAYAMHHIADVFPPDQPSAQQTVQASITGLPSGTGHSLALTGSDGSIIVYLWNEAPVWNAASQFLQLVTPVPVQVAINGSWNVSYFTPAEDSTFPIGQVNGQYQTYVSSYPTALIFKKK